MWRTRAGRGGYDRLVSDQESLFGDVLNDGDGVAAAPSAPPDLSQWRIDQLRAALDKRGLASVADRKSAVEAIVGRKLTNLRDLTAAESTTVLEALSLGRSERATSSWDDRDADTWIDKL